MSFIFTYSFKHSLSLQLIFRRLYLPRISLDYMKIKKYFVDFPYEPNAKNCHFSKNLILDDYTPKQTTHKFD
jgi:hypothetical protein